MFMLSDSDVIIGIVVLLIVQFLLSGGLVSFLIISKKQEDKLFPRDKLRNSIPRFMHRRRLDLALSIVFLESIVLFMFPVLYMRLIVGRGLAVSSLLSTDILWTFLLTVFSISVVSIVAFGLSSRRPNSFAFWSSFLLMPFYFFFKPLTAATVKFVSIVFPDLTREVSSSFFLFSELEEAGNGFIEENGSRLMHSIVEFGDKKVREVMVPRIDVFALDVSTSCEEARIRISQVGHSRIPVYEGSIDNIAGVLYAKDLLKIEPEEFENTSIEKFLREAHFVPESKKIDDLLREFQHEKKHIAIVVDEYGGTSGIVTLEDILEEIVGEIRDEYDQEKPLIRRLSPEEYLVEGRINLDELSEETGISFSSEDVDTLGGYIYDILQKVPEEGEEIEYEGILFKIRKLQGQRITEVIIRIPSKEKK